MYKWMSKLVLIHGGVRYGEEEQLIEFNKISFDDDEGSDDENDMDSESEIEFEGYDLDELEKKNK